MIINTTSNDIKNKAIISLKEKTPFNMLRMGDGEMIIANNVKDKLPQFSINQIGRELKIDELRKTQENMINSVLYSNVLGLPTEEHIRKNKLWEILLTYYDKIKTNNPDLWVDKEYCTINSHLELLKNNHLFDILSESKKIVIVSPRDIVDKLYQKFPNLEHIEYYSVPGEQKYEINKNTEINIFSQVDLIIENLKSKDRGGELLLYGVGPFGKHLGYEFSKLNGVSLDLGSVFDLLVGKITRGVGKGANSYTNSYL